MTKPQCLPPGLQQQNRVVQIIANATEATPEGVASDLWLRVTTSVRKWKSLGTLIPRLFTLSSSLGNVNLIDQNINENWRKIKHAI
jgi:hypothetical protein